MYARMLTAAAGIAATTLLSSLPPLSLVVATLPLLLPLLWCPAGLPRLAGAFAAGFCWGALCGHHLLAHALPEALDGRDAQVRVCIEGLPEQRRERGLTVWRLRARLLEPWTPRGLPAWRGRTVEFSWYGEGEFHAGEAWRLRLRLRAPRGFLNPGSADRQAWLHADGVDATGYATATHAAQREGVCAAGADPWRERLRERLLRMAGDHPGAAGLLALTIGDGSGFTPGDWALFAATGTTHLVVISGMHISLVAGLAFAVGMGLPRRVPALAERVSARSCGAILALPAVVGYAALAGWSLSVQRAVLMTLAMVLAVLLERHRPVFAAFALSALVVLAVQPLGALQPGFWLSYASVAALLLGLGGRLVPIGWREALWRPQIVVALALAPALLAMNLPQAPLGPLVNVIAIPIVDLVAVPAALLACVLSEISESLAIPFVELALAALDLLRLFLVSSARAGAGAGVDAVPGAGSPPAWAICLAVLGSLWMLAPRGFPGRWCGVLLFLPAFFPPQVRPPALEVLVLDVGQGSAAIVRTHTYTLVFDAGPRFTERFDAGRAIVVPALRWQGAGTVDMLVVSHADNDHAGGAAGVRAGIGVRDELAGEPPPGSGVRRCVAGMHWRREGADFRILHPREGDRREGNGASCVLRVEVAGRVILLTGDIDAEAERAILARDPGAVRADVVLAPHHGSRSSSTPRFVTAVAPRFVVYSSGYRNRFGHPHPEVVARWRATGAESLDTAGSGAVLFRMGSDGSLATPETWRERERRFWHRRPAGEG